ncbi:MAG: ABC transporter ATP-binding protein/permease [Oscillospiraceae bacterium]|jgi:ABC-type multidrug transport system fused ATPase/permease subunit|nr:ABC transporter ATP-binding protein/permease [Oscillospiraceae bacterium]
MKNIELKTVWKDLKWIFKYVKSFRFPLIVIILLDALGSLTSVASATISKYLINAVTGDIPLSALGWIIPVITGSFAVSLIIRSVTSKISVRTSTKLNNLMRQDVFDHALSADWQSVSEYHSGDLLNRMTGDVSSIVSTVMDTLPGFVSLIVRLVAAFFVILRFDASMGLIILLICPVAVVLAQLVGRKLRKFDTMMRERMSKSQSFIQESLQNIMIIKSFGLENLFMGRLKKHQKDLYDIALEKNSFAVKLQVLFSVLYQLASYSVMFWGAYRLYNHAITFGDYTAFISLAGQIQSPLVMLITMLPSAITSTSSAERLITLFGIKPEEPPPENEQPINNYSIELKQVNFAYNKGETVLENVSLLLPSGQITALIGPSGEGKTTLIRLFLGLIQPQSGTILIGETLSPSGATRPLFAYVPQGNTLFSGSVRENLLLGSPDAEESELRKALKQACALEFVEKLPQGMDTNLGEKGLGLSEGQAQRIAIARALLRKAPFVLLDEATSALDMETEQRILANIQAELKSRTCIVITHRVTAFDLCHKIYRIKGKSASLVKGEGAVG